MMLPEFEIPVDAERAKGPEEANEAKRRRGEGLAALTNPRKLLQGFNTNQAGGDTRRPAGAGHKETTPRI